MHRSTSTIPPSALLGRVLRRQAEATPEAPFVLATTGRFGYGRSERAGERLARGLRELGIRRGDTVRSCCAVPPRNSSFGRGGTFGRDLGAI